MTDRSTLVPHGHVVATILHTHGTLRVFRNAIGRLHVEVIGFDSDEGRQFLGELGCQLEDITAEVLVCADPAAYGAPVLAPIRHHRRVA